MNVCLSDLRIDMWLARDLGAPEQTDARAHVDGCAACAARVARIEAARAASVPDPDLETLRRVAARRAAARPGGWRSLWRPFGAVLVAAATAFVVTARPPEPARGTRTKGSAHVGLYVKHRELVRRGGLDERVSPGDVVRFTASTARPAHLAILGVDAVRHATVYFPLDGAADAVPAGEDVPLPRATVLDDTLGPEAVYALFCARPIDRAALAAARSGLEEHPQAAPALAGCAVDRIDLVKVRAP